MSPEPAHRREASDFLEPGSESVGEVVRRWARRTGLLRLSDRERIWEAWQALLGPDADHTRLEGLRNRVATFAVDSSALLMDLRQFQKPRLLAGLRQEVRTCFVEDIRFRLDKRRPARRP